jgi:cytochrome c
MKIRWLCVPAVAGFLFMIGGQAYAADGKPDVSKDEFLAIAKKSGCLACHSIDKKIVGPPWALVSQDEKKMSYADAMKREEHQIINGGKGKWVKLTGGVPMPPYGPRVSDADRKKLADFIVNIAKVENLPYKERTN